CRKLSAAIGCERRRNWRNLTTEITLNGQRPRMPLTSMKKTPQQGEIWVVNFDPTRGAEIKKPRPARVVSADDIGVLPLRIVVPITQWDASRSNLPWFVPLPLARLMA